MREAGKSIKTEKFYGKYVPKSPRKIIIYYLLGWHRVSLVGSIFIHFFPPNDINI